MSYVLPTVKHPPHHQSGRPKAVGFGMGKVTRQKKLSELISRHGECSIELLAQELAVSEMTIRRDLQSLTESGKVIRTHGGAAMGDRVSFEFKFLERSNEHREAKEAIAKLAAEKIGDSHAVLLDSGTTTLAIAEELKSFSGLTVVTTSLPIAARLQFCPDIQVLLLGGYLRESTPDLSGALTESNLSTLRADVAFLGTQGIDAEGRLYQQTPELASLVSKMSATAEAVYVVADSSKLGKTSLCQSGRVQDCAGLITDIDADRKFVKGLVERGAQVFQTGRKLRKSS